VCTGHFVECYTRQREGLPSVRAIALGKEPIPGHRYSFFGECVALALGKEARFAECHTEHSANKLIKGPVDRFFAECWPVGTLQQYLHCRVSPRTLCKDAVSVTSRPWWPLFFTEYHLALGKLCAECPTKSTRQRSLCWCTFCWALFAECDTRQRLCRVFFWVCWVLQALGKAPDSSSDNTVDSWCDTTLC
jgi:hypothetical protein